ncbi:uncharacterized protein EURHEDRAFT_549127 [Aspergillus ruber CBS 135680]|uniref:Uncharacterized protein n=1 Tax=Aspergillus ruber (strain CBS 135680) TaxID=1388766 RepID=A0A017S358_ASPRC|nr:uncharacterized protein EURHEDRAFT_549127 [Aspergillus ruber CBS 135680]EYE90595.1 hypothetical protein EURHEDRAFT_549127 [Aspergillus ruber CBS 135680]
MRELTRWQSGQLISLQEKAQERSLWPLLVEPEQKPLQHKSRDGSLRSLDSGPNKVNDIQATEELAARPGSCNGSQAPRKPLFSTEVRTCSYRAYLHRIRVQKDATCEGCGISRETTHHLLFECREWRHQRNRLYKDLETDGVMRPTTAEEYPQGRLLGEAKATKALLQFLASINIALPRAHLQRMAERARRDDEWGLEALEKAVRIEEG